MGVFLIQIFIILLIRCIPNDNRINWNLAKIEYQQELLEPKLTNRKLKEREREKLKGKYKSFKPLNTGFYVVNKVVSEEHGQNNNKNMWCDENSMFAFSFVVCFCVISSGACIYSLLLLLLLYLWGFCLHVCVCNMYFANSIYPHAYTAIYHMHSYRYSSFFSLKKPRFSCILHIVHRVQWRVCAVRGVLYLNRFREEENHGLETLKFWVFDQGQGSFRRSYFIIETEE